MIAKSKKQEKNVVVGLSVCTVVEYAQWNLLGKKITIGVWVSGPMHLEWVFLSS